jgi:hypothetical protein
MATANSGIIIRDVLWLEVYYQKGCPNRDEMRTRSNKGAI